MKLNKLLSINCLTAAAILTYYLAFFKYPSYKNVIEISLWCCFLPGCKIAVFFATLSAGPATFISYM
jgi:hypothetical protein